MVQGEVAWQKDERELKSQQEGGLQAGCCDERNSGVAGAHEQARVVVAAHTKDAAAQHPGLAQRLAITAEQEEERGAITYPVDPGSVGALNQPAVPILKIGEIGDVSQAVDSLAGILEPLPPSSEAVKAALTQLAVFATDPEQEVLHFDSAELEPLERNEVRLAATETYGFEAKSRGKGAGRHLVVAKQKGGSVVQQPAPPKTNRLTPREPGTSSMSMYAHNVHTDSMYVYEHPWHGSMGILRLSWNDC